MKFRLYLILAVCLSNYVSGKTLEVAGPAFEFDYKNELDAQFVLVDNYNHYLLSVFNTDGMMANRRMVLRKFDQKKNQLVDTYSYPFPKYDTSTLYEYLGSTETGAGKVIVYTKSYSNKAKKSEIVAHVFDKATAAFTSTVIDSNPILSAGKSGDVYMQKSDNGNYVGIIYTRHRPKNEPEKTLVMVIDNNSQNVTWKKETEFTNDHLTKSFVVTNNGKVVLLRDNASFKKANNYNFMVLVSGDAQDDKSIETPIFLQKMQAVSIGAQDYILAFNANSRGTRQTNFTDLLFYDLKQGKTLQNIEIPEFSKVKYLANVLIREISLQNNEIYLFAEAKAEVVTKPTANTTTAMIMDKVYTYGPSYLYTLSFEGTLKSTKKLTTLPTRADASQSFGLLNVKGTYYITTGYQSSPHSTVYNTLYTLNAANGYEPVKKDSKTLSDHQYVYQLLHYFADSSTLLTARIEGDNKMALINFTDLKL